MAIETTERTRSAPIHSARGAPASGRLVLAIALALIVAIVAVTYLVARYA